MRCDKSSMRLYAVTDRAWTGKMSLYEQVKAALENGVSCVQLREKHMKEEEFLQEAKELAELCRSYHVPFIVNDQVEIAIACHADGIHVGQDDMDVAEVRRKAGPDMIIGVSAHTVEEALAAERGGADYLGLGAVFSTSTKQDVNTMSYETLKAICDAVKIPTVAIGGISAANVMQLAGSGVDGIAVVSAIFGAEDPGAAAKELAVLSEAMVSQ